jgi:hypothetical protein
VANADRPDRKAPAGPPGPAGPAGPKGDPGPATAIRVVTDTDSVRCGDDEVLAGFVCASGATDGAKCATPGTAATGVPVGNLRSEILVVQPAQNWHRQRATDGLDGTRDRCVLVQR